MSRQVVILFVLLTGGFAGWWLAGEREQQDAVMRQDAASSTERTAVETSREPVLTEAPSAVTQSSPLDLPLRSSGFHELRIELAEQVEGLRFDEAPRLESVAVRAGWATPDGVHGPVVSEAFTDTDGRALLRMEFPAGLSAVSDPAPRFWVEAERLGYLGLTYEALLPQDEFHSYMQRGARFTARVLDAEGRPAAGTAWLRRADTGDPISGSGREADEHGLVQFVARQEGRFVVLAKGYGDLGPAAEALAFGRPFHLGAGLSEPFDVDFEAPPSEPVVVRLRGGALLRGQLVDTNGRPLAGTTLQATLQEEPQHVWGSTRTLDDELRGERYGSVVTDLDGRFEIGGLQPGLYHVAALEMHELDASSPRLTPAPIPADGRLHRIVRADESVRLVIHLRDPAGAVIADTDTHWLDQRSAPGDEWPERARVVVWRARSPAPRTPFEELGAPVVQVAPGEFTYQAVAGERYVVGLLAPDRAWRAQFVEIPHEAKRVDVTLVAPDRVPQGTLELSIRDPGGEVVTRDLRLRIFDAQARTLLLDSASRLQSLWTARHELPAGRYIVRVDSAARRGPHGGGVLSEHGGAEAAVEVESGEQLDLALTLGVGARLRVHATGNVSDADLRAVTSEFEDSDEAESLIAFWQDFVTLSLRRDGGELDTPEFTMPAPKIFGRRAARSTLLGGVRLDDPRVSGALAPGRATLIARLPGGRRLERELELVDGATLDVTLDFH